MLWNDFCFGGTFPVPFREIKPVFNSNTCTKTVDWMWTKFLFTLVLSLEPALHSTPFQGTKASPLFLFLQSWDMSLAPLEASHISFHHFVSQKVVSRTPMPHNMLLFGWD